MKLKLRVLYLEILVLFQVPNSTQHFYSLLYQHWPHISVSHSTSVWSVYYSFVHCFSWICEPTRSTLSKYVICAISPHVTMLYFSLETIEYSFYKCYCYRWRKESEVGGCSCFWWCCESLLGDTYGLEKQPFANNYFIPICCINISYQSFNIWVFLRSWHLAQMKLLRVLVQSSQVLIINHVL